MTDIDRIIAAGEVAQRAVKRRKTQAFTAEEEPIVLAGLFSMLHLLSSLLDKERQHETQDHPDSTGTMG
jgi:hypothetical protein